MKWIHFKNNAILMNNLLGKLSKLENSEEENEFLEGIIELTEEEQEKLNNLLKEKLIKNNGKLKATTLTEHTIDVQMNPPIKQRYYHVSPKIKEEICTEVDRLLEEDIIESSQSDWSYPIVMIKKPDGKYRFCLDFRKVNIVTKKDLYPVPLMAEILDMMNSAKYISKIDLKAAYNQIPLNKNSRPITAFVVPGKGMYQFKRMPFGLCNAPATFRRFMDKLITPELKPKVFCYLDDIIIVSESFEEHLYYLNLVLGRLFQAGLTINLDKCEFGCSEIKYLGFLINKCGLQVDPEKIHPVVNFPTPKNIKELQRFIGMSSWYKLLMIRSM